MVEMNEIKNNCRYRAKLDMYNNLHILDCSGLDPFVSVTNSVDWLVPYLLQHYGVYGFTPYIFLYGTDREVFTYDALTQHFTMVKNNLPIDGQYLMEMNYMYSQAKGFQM